MGGFLDGTPASADIPNGPAIWVEVHLTFILSLLLYLLSLQLCRRRGWELTMVMATVRTPLYDSLYLQRERCLPPTENNGQKTERVPFCGIPHREEAEKFGQLLLKCMVLSRAEHHISRRLR